VTTYERVDEHGRMVERVTPAPGDLEDIRLGCAVLDGTGGWRVQGAEPVQAEQPPAETTPTIPAGSTPNVGPRRAEQKESPR